MRLTNLLENVVVEVNDQSVEKKPIVVRDNILENSPIDHRRGKLVARDDGPTR